ncbi:hypothetical protein D0T87_02410 [Bacteroides sp. 51]|nr:hypothetical protein [Bacteroides sp. 51]
MKLFISYCWTDQDHENWVLTLAEELVENGIHVVLDKWDLKEGHDSYAFMEKMVSDPDIKKVLIISDKKYAEKANQRDGGVGTETQIISPEIYKNQKQEKFVALVVERDELGAPYLPIYYNTRKYIDFCNVENYADSFELLLRWVYDKPLYKRPPLGKRPAFLEEQSGISLGTSLMAKRIIAGIKEAKPYRFGALDEYLSSFSLNIERFRIDAKPEEYDDILIDRINSFTVARDEFIFICITLCQYSDDLRIRRFHAFFERLIPYFRLHRGYEHDNDIFKFIANELFLYYVAVLLKYEKFQELDEFLAKEYMENEDSYGTELPAFLIFCNYLKSLGNRNSRLGLNKLSLHATLLKERCKHLEIDFNSIMQADYILFLRAEHLYDTSYTRWWPQTLIYAEYQRRPFEVFFRAQSQAYFDSLKDLLSFDNLSSFKLFIDEYYEGKREIPRWQFNSIHPKIFSNYEKLCTKK